MTHVGTRPLDTARLRLRPLSQEDAPAFFDIMRDEQVVRFLMFPLLRQLSQAEQVIARDLELYDTEPNFYIWGIERRDSGVLAGTIGLSVVSEAAEIGEVGYSLGRPHWGQGFATEALRAVLGFAFHTVGFNRVEGKHDVLNPASGKVMRRAGMAYEGMAREKYKNHLGYHDAHLYGMLKRDF